MKMRERLKQNNSAFKIASTAKMAVKMVFGSSSLASIETRKQERRGRRK